jgi:hypothetical protein
MRVQRYRAMSNADEIGAPVVDVAPAHDVEDAGAARLNGAVTLSQAVLRFLFAIDPGVAESYHRAQAGSIGRLLDLDPPDLALDFVSTRAGSARLALLAGGVRVAAAQGDVTRHLLRIGASLDATAPRSLGHAILVAADREVLRGATAPADRLAREGLAILLDPRGPDAQRDAELRRDAVEKFHAARGWAEAAHRALHVPGRDAATFEVIAVLVAEFADMPAQEFRTRLRGMLAAKGGGGEGARVSLAAMLRALAQAGFAGLLIRAADTCLMSGMHQAQRAFETATIDGFPRAIHGAMPLFIAAGILANELPETEAIGRRRLLRTAQAYLLRGLQALHHAIADTPDRTALRAYRAAIARRASGQDVRHGALELTDLLMVYPASCRKILLGETMLSPS